MEALRNALAGTTPPLVTPFDGTDLALDAFDRLLDHVVSKGSTAVFPCGTTGEAASLSLEEKRQLVRHAVDRTPRDVPVVPGGTYPSVQDIHNWIDELASLGADGVFLTIPYFHQANDPAGYRTFLETIADSSPLPVVLYNIPSYVGAEIPVDVVTSLANHEHVIGLKDSSGDLGYGMMIQDQTPDDFLVLQGIDELLLPSLRIGFDGGVNAGANVFPDIFAAIVHTPVAETSLEYHRSIVRPLFELCHDHGFAPGIKAALASREIIDCTDVRPPLVSLPSER